jgi:hypothetical protein
MKSFFSVCILSLLLIPPAAEAAEILLKGTLAYREACRDGLAAPFGGDLATRGPAPQLYLIDRTGAVVSEPVVPASTGAFELSIPYAGQFALKVAAGKVIRFWRNGIRTAIPVTIPSARRAHQTYALGTVCANVEAPRNLVRLVPRSDLVAASQP